MKVSRLAVVTALLLLLGGPASAQIQHEPVDCLVADRFPRLQASFQPMDALARARLVFRPAGGRYWYSVPMTPEADVLAAVLPKPKASLKSVEYYVEVTDAAALVTRTAEHVARVAGGPAACQDARVASSVGSATVALEVPTGAPAVPAGFSSSGLAAGASAGAVAGTAVAATTAAAAGGGVATGVLVGAGVAVAAGAGVAVASAGGGEGDSGPPPGEPPDRPIQITISASAPEHELPYPFTVQAGGQSVSSPSGARVELTVTVAPGAHEVTMGASRAGEFNFGFRVGRDSGPGGVDPGSIDPGAPVMLNATPCGYTVRAPGPFTVRFRVITGFAGTCSAGGAGG